MSRERLPSRRPNETIDLEINGTLYAVTVGYYPDGRVAEVFTHGAKVGSTMDAILDDACILFSLLLQYGVEPAGRAPRMGWLGDDRQPSSIIGALAGLLSKRQDASRVSGPVSCRPAPGADT